MPTKDYDEVSRQLSDSRMEELNAIGGYRRRAEYARKRGLNWVAELYDHIIKEEEHHQREFLNATEDLFREETRGLK